MRRKETTRSRDEAIAEFLHWEEMNRQKHEQKVCIVMNLTIFGSLIIVLLMECARL